MCARQSTRQGVGIEAAGLLGKLYCQGKASPLCSARNWQASSPASTCTMASNPGKPQAQTVKPGRSGKSGKAISRRLRVVATFLAARQGKPMPAPSIGKASARHELGWLARLIHWLCPPPGRVHITAPNDPGWEPLRPLFPAAARCWENRNGRGPGANRTIGCQQLSTTAVTVRFPVRIPFVYRHPTQIILNDSNAFRARSERCPGYGPQAQHGRAGMEKCGHIPKCSPMAPDRSTRPYGPKLSIYAIKTTVTPTNSGIMILAGG
eukprot:gene22729-biopygen8789